LNLFWNKKMLSITEEKLDEFLSGFSLLFFWSSWCGPCNDASYLNFVGSQIKLGLVNVGENPNLANEYSIFVVPTFVFFKDKKVVKKFVGIQDKEFLRNFILNIDKYL